MQWWRLLLAVLIVFGATAPAGAQSVIERLITPGPLSSAHAALEARCNTCHQSFSREAQNGRCLDCHRGIGSDIQLSQGYHGRTAARRQACKTCHSDHQGRNFDLVKINRATFNHDQTDYPLTGAHARVTCAQCHGKTTHFRNAPSSCIGCHQTDDPHRGGLGTKCQSCHQVSGWRDLLPFDHRQTGFTLTGAHRDQRCVACHTNQRWKNLPSQCVACHAKDDSHRGARGKECGECHNSTNWKAAVFDHGRLTSFPLLGRHAATSCAACHGPDHRTPRPGKACVACHAKEDKHLGKLGTSCGNCHDASGWKSIRFDHSQTKFPLRGGHVAASCAACHGKDQNVQKPDRACITCHKDDDERTHQGHNGADCERCHSENNWKIERFDHDRMTDFALTGAHRPLKCTDCHKPPEPPREIATPCSSCHTDDDVHKGALTGDCSNCHGTTTWKENIRFDHGLTRFPLLGKHGALVCKDCHVDQRFVAAGVTCQSCHKDNHHEGGLGVPSACGTCHDSSDWRQWRFDHDKQTDFALTGQHAGLICSACHSRPGDPAKTSTACIACHRREDKHQGGFGDLCERCHVTSSFRDIRIIQLSPSRNDH